MKRYILIARDNDGAKRSGIYDFPESLEQVKKHWRRFCKDNGLRYVSVELLAKK